MVQQEKSKGKQRIKQGYMVTGYNIVVRKSALKSFRSMRGRKNLDVIDLENRGEWNGSREHHRESLVVRTDIK